MKRRLFRIVSVGLLIGGLSGCQMTRGWFSASRLGLPVGPKSGAVSKNVKSPSKEIRPVSAQQEVPIVTADEQEPDTGVSRWSKLLGSLTKPKRIPLPRTDAQPAESESEKTPELLRDGDVPSLNDF